jgi:hypothetical protein
MSVYGELAELRAQQAYACNLRVAAVSVIEYPISGDKLTKLKVQGTNDTD